MILYIVVFVIFLGFLLLLHEAGHFFVSKIFRVKVEEFGIGYPPRIWKKKLGETDYSINLLPFGGFVKILGENEIVDDKKTHETPSVESKTLSPNSLLAQKPWKKFLIMVAGIGLNFLAGIIFLAAGYMVGLPAVVGTTDRPVLNPQLSILAVDNDSPAKSANLTAGDIILGVKSNEEEINDSLKAVDFQNFVKKYKGQEIVLKIEKSSKEIVSVPVLTRINPPEGKGSLGVAIGEVGTVKYSFFASFWQGIKSACQTFINTFVMIYLLIKGIFIKNDIAGNLVGPIGIAVMGGQTVQLGIGYLLQFLAGLSISLAALNLLPIPALDGGRILFILIEKIIRRPVSTKLEGGFHGVGFILLIAVSIFVAARDIVKLF